MKRKTSTEEHPTEGKQRMAIVDLTDPDWGPGYVAGVPIDEIVSPVPERPHRDRRQEIVCERLPGFAGGRADLPRVGHDGDAGLDLYVAETTLIRAGEFADVPTGLRMQLPDGYWARITGRSSTIRKHKILVIEGIIDQGYTGPIFTGVWNMGTEPKTILAGERLAQLILHPLVRAQVSWGSVHNSDARGGNGFGSTGS